MIDKELQNLIDIYGRDSLVCVGFLKQIMFYAKNGCQPKFIYENELKPGYITAWYLKEETIQAKKAWDNTKKF